MSSPGYKSLLQRILPLAVATDDAQRELIASAVRALGLAEANAKARSAAYYKANTEACKARAKAQRRTTPEQRRMRYKSKRDHYQEKGREYAAKRRTSGKAAAYTEALKRDGRTRAYNAKYKYGAFGEAALVLYDLERALKHTTDQEQ